LVEDTRLGDIHFDDIMQNKKNHRGKVQEEYAVLMTNGNTVGKRCGKVLHSECGQDLLVL
jgi:hypothetical protein